MKRGAALMQKVTAPPAAAPAAASSSRGSGLAALSIPEPVALHHIEPRDLAAAVAAGAIVVDVRSDEERADGYLDGSAHVPCEMWYPELQDEPRRLITQALSSSAKLIFHCMYSRERGPRAARKALDCAASLQVAILRGGFQQALTQLSDPARPSPLLKGVRADRWVSSGRHGLVWAADLHPLHPSAPSASSTPSAATSAATSSAGSSSSAAGASAADGKHRASAGHYVCVVCNAALYDASSQFAFSDCKGVALSFDACYQGALAVDAWTCNGRLLTRCVGCDSTIGLLYTRDGCTPTAERHKVDEYALCWAEGPPPAGKEPRGLLQAEAERAMRSEAVAPLS